MPTEIEAKLQVPSHDPTRSQLQALGAQFLGHFLELNTFLDTPERSLLSSDQGLRIRQSTNTATNQSTIIITHKGPRQPGPLKSREELELTVANFNDALALLAELGYHPTLTFEKRRESWLLNNCHIELDTLPHLGPYVEIEGPTESAVDHTRSLLHLTSAPLITPSYAALLSAHAQSHNLPPHSLRF